MDVTVVGLWHLGCVTAACLAKAGHRVMAYDANPELIHALQNGASPIFEPGLDDLLAQTTTTQALQFSCHLEDIKKANIAWITYDTPVDDQDEADIDFVMHETEQLFPYLQPDTLILISSQLPVGSTRRLAEVCDKQYKEKKITFAYSPENLRLGKAIDVFTHPDRIIVGLQTDTDKPRIQALLAPFTQHIVWMSIESAEMTKHAINAFLATSVVFINELSTLCERTGADARDVERGLKTEERIGPKAYLRPGGAIGGGTLLRDVHFLRNIGKQKQVDTPFFSGLLDSNQTHKQWSCQRMAEVMKTLRNKTVATLGLTYKVGTDTLRRSSAIETCTWLHEQGAKVVAYDPLVKVLPDDLSKQIQLKATIKDLLDSADALIVATECAEFSVLTTDILLSTMKEPLVFDASGFLMKALGTDQRIRYYSVGR